MDKKITVSNPGELPTIPWAELKESFEPNNLKAEKNRDVGDLKKSIVQNGFKYPIFIWVGGKYIADGAGRFKALDMLDYEGYEIPDIPYLPVEASSKAQAKKAALEITSQYGKITNDSLGAFVLDLGNEDLELISLPGFDMEELEWKPPTIGEVDMDEIEKDSKGKTKMEHTCPGCGHKFTTT